VPRCRSCWPTGRTDLLKGFISNKTRRKFSAFLVRDPSDGKVGFEFEPRAPKAGAVATGEILDFWFLPAGDYRAEWFRKDDAFDAAIRERFGAAVDAALAGTAPAAAGDGEMLARILLLDQFTRNIFRGTPRAFAGDAQALALATQLVSSGRDKNLDPWQRWFAYLPFEHAESLLEQERSVALFAALAREAQLPAFDSALDYAVRHREVIVRFGRFPHRNALLGRASTAEESAFLAQPGSSF
jgi:uncharacterized protein (DUF924 family)